MVRRSTPQRIVDDRSYPIRVRVAVPPGGFGGLYDRFDTWLREEVGATRYACHSGPVVGGNSIALYFVDMADAKRFLDTFPELQLADLTPGSAYRSPYRLPD